MNIHEYQGKELLQSYGLDVGQQILCKTPAEVKAAQQKIGGTVVIKAQVLVGGRGKAGGVKLAKTPEEAEQRGKEILGLDIKGNIVDKVIVVPAAAIKKEFYCGLTLDRFGKRLVLMISAEGGVDIEELAVERPDAIVKFHIYPTKGIDESGLKKVLEGIFKDGPAAVKDTSPKTTIADLVEQAVKIVRTMYKVYLDKGCTLVEVNPLALLADGRVAVLDAKVNFDDNELYAHADIEALRNPEENSAAEIAAREAGLSFVSMDGYIGCIVNGAGLAMATMDIVKLFGGQPANFLDVGGSSNPNKVVSAIKIIMSNPKIKGIFLNIFGGITRCDDIANGLLMALDQVKVNVPLVVRLIGTNDQEGRKILEGRGITAFTDLNDAVKKVVAQANGGKAA